MQINWFTVIAQIINFLVLVWLMKKYLYTPILNAIADREKKIAGELADAKAQKAEAKREHEEFDKKNNAFNQEKKQMLEKAVAETEAERQKLMDTAKSDAKDLREKLEKTSAALQQDLNDHIAQKTEQEVIAITRKALSQLASSSLEEQTVNVFVKRINNLNDEAKEQFKKAFQSDKKPVMVTSAFEMPENGQKEITGAIDKELGSTTQYNFNTDPKVISGIELSTDGYKLSWSLSAYISSLEMDIAAATKEKPATPEKTHHAAH